MKPNFGLVRIELSHLNQHDKRALHDTIDIYRDAVSFLLPVICDNYSTLASKTNYEAMQAVEHMVHKTKENPFPSYPLFDLLFYKLPSYIRRAAIHDALGQAESHQTRCEQYDAEREKVVTTGRHYKKMMPAFHFHPNACPTLYKGNMFQIEGKVLKIKIRIRNTWDWICVTMPHRDYKNLMKAQQNGILKNPMLSFAYHKFYLSFPVAYHCRKMQEQSLEAQTVLAVDQGLNNGAVCSVIDALGNVLARDFDPFEKERKDMEHIMNLIRKKYRTSGTGQCCSHLYTKLQGMKENYVRQLSRWVTNLAIRYRVYGIVLEHLEKMKGRKTIAMRLHHWCTARVRDYIKGMAFREGIRTFLVNPKGTSLYAYDGSGKVTRNRHNYSLCVFSTGKQYHCDLSASYNIGARYFLRAYKKSIPVKEWSQFMAKVPELAKRTNWTLATLRKFQIPCPETTCTA